jgi:hypothetical protein
MLAGFRSRCGCLPRRQQIALKFLIEAAARHKLECEKRLPIQFADFKDLHDVGMEQACGGLRLPPKAQTLIGQGRVVAAEHFQGHDSVQTALPRSVDHAHAAAAQLFE